MLSHWFSFNISPSEFFTAVESSDLRTVRQYLYQHRFNLAAINVVNHDGDTALILACKRGRVAILKALLTAPGIDVNAANENGTTALMAVFKVNQAGADRREMMNDLLDVQGIHVGARSEQGHTALIHAASRGFNHMVNDLLEEMSVDDVNIADEEGKTALFWAAENGYELVLEALLAVEGMNVNIRAINGFTALMAADDAGYTAVVDRLLLIPEIDTYGWDVNNLGAEEEHAPVIAAANPVRSLPRRTLNFQERLDAINYTGVVPAVHCCPISLCVMDKPIVVSSGQVYDLESLQALFQGNQDSTKLCAVTRLIIRREELQNVPCTTIKDAIEKFVIEQERAAAMPAVQAVPEPIVAAIPVVNAERVDSDVERLRFARLRLFDQPPSEDRSSPDVNFRPR